MADEKNNCGPQDRSRINLSDDCEACYWTDKLGVLGVSTKRLEDAVNQAAASARAVEAELRHNTLTSEKL
ncbi:MAG: DUF3606 domain-containing protein [Bradyrhizobiaceae bacterium]|nr:MAG: DUF3606 domain-containing protein [Bradyrhizobiaceae bacterium]